MFVSDRIVFLELQKTGCTHIRNLLKELVGGELVGKHNQASPALFSGGRFFLGSVRNPWDWYISLWAYGCDRKGALFANLTQEGLKIKGRGWRTNPYAALRGLLGSSPNRNAEAWKRVYADVNDAGAFREWLRMMHDWQYLPEIGEGYRQSGLSRVTGLLTYRYMKLFACKEGEPDRAAALSTFDDLVEYERKHCFIDHFIRNENLESDLLAGLKLAEIGIPAETESNVVSRPKTNTSSRKRGTAYYYDSAAEALVADRDRLIVEKFGYHAPGSREG